MATIAELLVRIGADTKDLRKELNATKRQINSAFGKDFMEYSRNASIALAGLGAGVVALGVKAVEAAGKFQSIKVALTNLTGSGEKAAAMIKDLQDFAQRTPFTFSQVTEASQKLMAMGFTAEQVIPTLTAVGDAAAAVGLGKEGIDRITLALGQMAAKGKVQAEEMRQLAEAGIPAWQMLADAAGTSIAEVTQMVTRREVDAQMGLSALIGGMTQRYGGLMEEQAQTINGSFAILMDGLERTMQQVGLVINDVLGLNDAMRSLGQTLGEFAAVIDSEGLASAIQQIVPPEVAIAIISLTTLITSLAVPAIVMMATKIASAVQVAWAALGAFQPLVAITIAAATAMYMLWQSGIKVNDVLDFFGIKSTLLQKTLLILSDSFDAVVSAGMNLINVLRPAIELFVGAVAFAFATGGQVVGLFVNTVAFLLSAMLSRLNVVIHAIDGGLQNLAQMFTDAKDFVVGALEGIGSTLANMAESILPSWANRSLGIIAGFVSKAVNWLDGLLSKLQQVNAEMGDNSGGSGASKEPTTTKSKSKSKTSIDWSNFSSRKNDSAPTFGSTAGGGGGGRKSEGSSSTKATAPEVSKADEVGKLVNDLTRNHASTMVNSYGSASEQMTAKWQTDYAKAIDGVEERWKSASDKYKTLSASDKEFYLKSLQEKGIAYELSRNDELKFEQITNEEKLAVQNDYYKKLQEMELNHQLAKAEIKQAYDELDQERLMNTLNAEYAMEESYNQGKLELMQAYEEAFMNSHMSTMQLIGDLAQSALGGLEKAFTDILTGAKSAKKAFAELGKAMLQTIAQYFAKTIAGMIMTNALGDILDKQQLARTTASATAAAAAWSPAAWAKLVVDPSAGPLASALLTAGLGTAAAAGASIGSVSSLSLSDYTVNSSGGINLSDFLNTVPQHASGGLFKRASLGWIGEGVDDEAVLPLNKNVFSNIAEGIVGAGGGAGGGVSAVLNNYGDINTGADMDDVMDEFSSAIAAGLRGA